MSKEQPDGRRGSQGHGCTLFTPVPGWLAEAEGQLLGDTEQEKQLGLRTVFSFSELREPAPGSPGRGMSGGLGLHCPDGWGVVP